ncbi:hypothetical protein [Photobacterium sp. 1_MG-2023]|uniref:hypothetical protein n=1 Tax=Photobacterium sp. 1_MG-2023 TaxID=3062646 RepID=UPI0026E46D4B|nr:hypothetical protein [Photobacterium sp. 1_MG-2023]MDO6706186.1 hypothetical protein [Photobacterium sp. 1_MG-2023]
MILEPGKVHKVITDKAIPERYLDGLKKAGIEVVLVDVDHLLPLYGVQASY